MKYDKMETVEKYGTVLEEDKSVAHRERLANNLCKLLAHSEFTKGELNEKLQWERGKLDLVLSGDYNISIYEITHIAEALGFAFTVSFRKNKFRLKGQHKQPWE